MTSFLNSVKADLLDRRLLPLVVVVLLGLAGAIGYLAVGTGSSSTAPASSSATKSLGAASGVAVSELASERAVAETTGGLSSQRGGTARNPFKPLAEPEAETSTTSSTSAPASSSSPSSSPSSSSSARSSEPSSSSTPAPETHASAPAPSKPAPPKTIYHVAVLFGALSAGSSAPSEKLTPYENLKLLAPLPASKDALIVYRGVTAGKGATFTLVSEAILHGNAACLPSESQCQAIALKTGQSEQLEYLTPSGQSETYELRVVSITSSKASAAAFEGILRDESKAGRTLLSQDGAGGLSSLSY